MAASLNGHIAPNTRHSIFHHPAGVGKLASVRVPDRRVEEIGPVDDDHFIREEGLFSGLSESQLRAVSSASIGGDDRGISLADCLGRYLAGCSAGHRGNRPATEPAS
jgi:hypothetical protein